MAHTREDVLALIRASFGEEDRDLAARLLDAYPTEACALERERVQLAIIKLSQGSVEKLKEHLAVAEADYRDVLLWADDPREARIDTPEKKEEVRGFLKKFGVEPPPGLED